MAATATIIAATAITGKTIYDIKTGNDAKNDAIDAARKQKAEADAQAKELEAQLMEETKAASAVDRRKKINASTKAKNPMTGMPTSKNSTIMTSPLGVVAAQTQQTGKTLLGS